MSEAKRNLPTDALVASSSLEFGPGQAEVEIYKHLLDSLDQDEPLRFNPRVNAELTSDLIDRKRGGIFTNYDVATAGLDSRAAMKLAQQRYICGVLGLTVGPLEIEPRYHTAGFSIDLPNEASLPPKPERSTEGGFKDSEGHRISDIQGDAIYAGYFIAHNKDHFDKPSAFEDMFRRIVEQAEHGRIEVADLAGDIKGVVSTVRQIARILGYQVGDFVKDQATGKFFCAVSSTRKGFDSPNTRFK